MIVTRTPFRISFLGGGTDYPAWYENYGPGAVISTAIDQYCYITCNFSKPFTTDYRFWIAYSELEKAQKIDDIKHPSAREVIRYLGNDRHLGISYFADLPGRAGLGSSSAFTVGLLKALHGLKGEIINPRQLAMEAIHIEQKIIKENVGSQDQTIAAFGGFNRIDFGGPDIFRVSPLILSAPRLNLFRNHLMLFFVNFPREASVIAQEQIRNVSQNKTELLELFQMVEEGAHILTSNANMEDFGQLLDEAWKIKRTLASNITTSIIDEVYAAAKQAGALGGKLLGAGSGGFMLFFIKPELQEQVKEKLKNLISVPFGFDCGGSKAIHFNPY
ncbi:MAG: kinase [bacterium]|nr:kinase [bacterium]